MKLKFLSLTTVLILVFASHIYSQQGTLDLGVTLMYNHGRVKDSEMFTNNKPISGFSTMLKLEYEPILRFRVSYGIGNITKGYSYEFDALFPNGTEAKVGVENRLDYLSNQLMVAYRIGNKLSVLPEFGISLDALLKQETTTGAVENIGEQKYSNKEFYRDVHTSLVYGVSVRYSILEKLYTGVHLKVSNGLQSISDDEVIYPEGKSTNLLVGAEVVWRIKSGN